MLLPLVLSLVTALCLAASLVLPGLADLAPMLAGAGGAALWLLASAIRRPRAARRRHAAGKARAQRRRWATAQRSASAAAPAAAAPLREVVVDGSNVMHWRGGTPQLATLNMVLRRLEAMGYSPGVVFDANAGHLLSGRYLHDGALARLLRLPPDRVMVVDKGQPADPMILRVMRELDVPVVSNDRFRDWAADWPEIREPARFIRGGWTDERLELRPGPALRLVPDAAAEALPAAVAPRVVPRRPQRRAGMVAPRPAYAPPQG